MAVNRLLYACCVLLALACQTQTRPQNGTGVKVDERPTYYDTIANEYVDKVLTNVREVLLDRNYDPYTALEYNLLGLNLVGELHGLASIHRSGDATVRHDERAVEISGKFGVYDLKVNLDWKFQLGFIPISGKVGGKVDEALIDADMRLDIESARVVITRFKVEKIGRVATDLKFPFPGFDYVAKVIADSVANLFKNVVVKLIEGPIHNFVQQTLDIITVPKFD